MDQVFEHLRVCVGYGANVVTVSEETLFPWQTSPSAAARLDELAKAHGVTITGTGHQDAFLGRARAQPDGLRTGSTPCMGGVRRTWTTSGRRSRATSRSGPRRRASALRRTRRPAAVVRAQHAGGARRRRGADERVRERTTRADIASGPVSCRSLGLEVPSGCVIGFTDVDRIETTAGIMLEFEMSGHVYAASESDVSDWTIAGEPTLRLVNPAVPTRTTTCTPLVNRIPNVINALPGLVTPVPRQGIATSWRVGSGVAGVAR